MVDEVRRALLLLTSSWAEGLRRASSGVDVGSPKGLLIVAWFVYFYLFVSDVGVTDHRLVMTGVLLGALLPVPLGLERTPGLLQRFDDLNRLPRFAALFAAVVVAQRFQAVALPALIVFILLTAAAAAGAGAVGANVAGADREPNSVHDE